MRNAKIYIIRAELEKWPNKTTGEVKEMTKIYYAIEMSNAQNSIGYAILKGYRPGNHIDFLKSRIMREVLAEIKEQATDNGSKYILVKIDNKEL